ncbi:MAG: ABC transporter ATP-binding protein, partial [Armatimonadetes bacterium]|nr:ABC transporter ATP-binding protein [Armatimonadota bacterium]
PAILLADEPTGNLDHETAIRVLQVIRDVNANQGKAVVMVTHNNAVAAMAHKVLRMRSGELVEVRRQETPADPLSLVW